MGNISSDPKGSISFIPTHGCASERTAAGMQGAGVQFMECFVTTGDEGNCRTVFIITILH